MRDKPKSFGGTIPWTRIEDIEGRSISRSLTDQNVSEETIKTMNLKIIPKGSLIVSASASFGIVALVKSDLITNQTFIGIVPSDNIDVEFLFYSFMSPFLRKEMKDEAAGSTIFYIPQDRFKNMRIFVPERSEQIRICTLFSNLDNLITLHQRKLDLLKKQKEGLLQKMFPKPGSDVPEIRFPGFTEPWKQRKLGEITQKVSEKNSSEAYNETFTNSAEYGIVKQSSFFDKAISNPENTKNYFVLHPNDFVYNPRISNSAPCGPIRRNKLGETGIISPLYTIFKVNQVDLGYLEYFFKSEHWYPFMYLNGNSGARADRFAIKDNEFFKMPIPVPSDISEQYVIGRFFTLLEESITLHQREPKL